MLVSFVLVSIAKEIKTKLTEKKNERCATTVEIEQILKLRQLRQV